MSGFARKSFPLVWGWALVCDPSITEAQPVPAAGALLTTAAQVRSLTASQAAQMIPVHLRGVIISGSDPRGRAVILADDTAGIYLLAATNLFTPWHREDLLEVDGVTDPGQFAPIVKVREARQVGTAPIPDPRRVSYQELITGALDGQWVEITGVVRRHVGPAKAGDVWRVFIAANGGVLSVRCPTPRDPQVQEDAEVRVQAVCLYQFNQKRQVLTPVLQVPEDVNVQVEKPAPANPFDAPVRSSESLLQFAPDNPGGHRVHVRGVVTHAQPGFRVWIRDAASGLRVQTVQEEDLQPGDEIDVLGFPAYGSFSPMLEDAAFRKTGTTRPAAPIPLDNATNAFAHEDDLITTEAKLTEIQPVMEGTALTLNAGGTVFKAVLKNAPNHGGAPAWQPGSEVRVAGICSMIHDDVRPLMGIWQPQTFQILMRSPADLIILRRPSWWTPRHVINSLVIVSLGLLLGTGTLMLLARRRLKEQAYRRAMAEAEFSAILAERNRMAREIHDTLAQGLTATLVQLRLAKKQAGAGLAPLTHHLDAAQQLLRDSLEEARNSIWNMRSQVLETGNLAEALKGILRQLADHSDLKTSFEVTGRGRRFAPVMENNLLRIGQEAITNATRHARAKTIQVRLDFSDRQFRMTVWDDGLGFDPANPPASVGGFGLVGMRERAAELKGYLLVRSAPGKGAEVSLLVPLSGE